MNEYPLYSITSKQLRKMYQNLVSQKCVVLRVHNVDTVLWCHLYLSTMFDEYNYLYCTTSSLLGAIYIYRMQRDCMLC